PNSPFANSAQAVVCACFIRRSTPHCAAISPSRSRPPAAPVADCWSMAEPATRRYQPRRSPLSHPRFLQLAARPAAGGCIPIAHAAAQLPRPAVFAGSAGLARHLPQAFGLAQNRESPSNLESVRSANEERNPSTPESRRPISGSGDASRAPLLFVVGSMSRV